MELRNISRSDLVQRSTEDEFDADKLKYLFEKNATEFDTSLGRCRLKRCINLSKSGKRC